MARASDLIRDSKLETHFLPGETVHTFQESDPISGRRLVTRSEHWRRQRRIGGGGFGSVWLEERTKGGRPSQDAGAVRAVKQIDMDTRLGSIDYKLYDRELEAIAKFSHSRVGLRWMPITRYTDDCLNQYERCFVKSFGWYEAPGQLFIAMEYLELGDLSTYLYRKPPVPPLPEAEAKEIAYQILEGLHMMHENRFAHRDLKPNNILIKSHPPGEWWIKLADFGITKRIEEAYQQSTIGMQGTPRYFAPEIWGYVARGSAYATDMWALGEVVFEMLTKKPAFADSGLLRAYKTQEQFPVAMLTATGTSQPGIDFVLSLMHPYPNDRVTASSAISNVWLQSLIPGSQKSTTVINGSPQFPASVAMSTEEFASWNTNPASEGPEAFADYVDPNLSQVEERWSEELEDLKSHSDDTELVAFSPDGQMQASGSHDKTVLPANPAPEGPGAFADYVDPNLSQVEERWSAELEDLKSHSDDTESVAFSPDSQMQASGPHDKTVLPANPPEGALQRTLKHSEEVISVAFSPDGRVLACACYDKSVRLWDPVTGTLLRTLKHSARVSSVAFSPSAQLLACGCCDKCVQLWDPMTGELLQTLKGHSGPVWSVAFSPDGRQLASGSEDKTVRLWDPAKKVRLWDRVTGSLYRTLKGHSHSVESVAYSTDGGLLASASYDKTVRLWNMATGALDQTLHEYHDSAYYSVAFSPDSSMLASGFPMLASGSGYNSVQLWDTATGARHRTLKGHIELGKEPWQLVSSVAFSPDGQLLASGYYNQQVRLWNTATGELHQSLYGHSDSVRSVAFSPDGRMLASGSEDKTVRLWEFQ